MNGRTLSSSQTLLMKCVFPVMWISVFGFGTLGLFAGGFRGANNSLPPESMKWAFLAGWIGGTMFIYWGCVRLKRVRIDGTWLYVSNYVREIRIPLEAIANVTENRWLNIHPVTIHLRSVSEFGDRIIFMPKVRMFHWRSHPVVEELLEMARPTDR